ncbi:hypothetical protein niasHS_003365 [Heterodera schachtii]|uniref:Uncharacterized protein n=1 Tax=Heterodera schachtii TaxID=97005 RepID=A0ABD2KGC3_HETSC
MSSGGTKSNLSYCAFDLGLVFVQRVLICVSAIVGYDLVSAPIDFPQMFLVGSVMRIIRNFFFITKAVRKWLAINYNDGVIPEPPVRCIRPTRLTRRSTPMDSRLDSQLSGGLKHSPIDHRYRSVKNYDLATALKERHNRSGGIGIEHRYYADHSSDFLAHSSSLSLRFLLNGLARSFTGCLADPDEEMNTQQGESDASQEKTGEKKAGADFKTSAEFLTDASENRRRNEMVVESVLENDAVQKLNVNSSIEKVPLPMPIFDDAATAFYHA